MPVYGTNAGSSPAREGLHKNTPPSIQETSAIVWVMFFLGALLSVKQDKGLGRTATRGVLRCGAVSFFIGSFFKLLN